MEIARKKHKRERQRRSGGREGQWRDTGEVINCRKVVTSIQEKAGGHEHAKSTALRTVGQSFKQCWDCSQIENEEEESEEFWHKEKTDGIAMGGRRGVRGDFGTKKDRRKLLEDGRHEKCT